MIVSTGRGSSPGPTSQTLDHVALAVALLRTQHFSCLDLQGVVVQFGEKLMSTPAPEEIAASNNGNEKAKWLSDTLRSPREILRFLYRVPKDGHDSYFARAALDVRISEDAAEQTDRFKQQMRELIGIAAAQKLLAEKLERQTDTLISLTRALKGLTILLVILTVTLVVLTIALMRTEHAATSASVLTALARFALSHHG